MAKLTAIEALHEQALNKLKALQDGGGPGGFAALVDAARYFAIADVCAAIRADRRALHEPPK